MASEHSVTYVSFVPKRRETASERFAQRVAKIRARGRPRFLEELDAMFEAPQMRQGGSELQVLRRLDQHLAVTDQGRDRREQLRARVGGAERRLRSSSNKGSAIPDQAAAA